jgi:hypothetical protein
MRSSDGEAEIGGKRYHIGSVGPNARVVQGDHNVWVETLGQAGANEVAASLSALLERVALAPDLTQDDRELAAAKVEAVAAALGEASQSPRHLSLALTDAKTFLSSKAQWVWSGLRSALTTDAARGIIAGITEAATRATIEALVGTR